MGERNYCNVRDPKLCDGGGYTRLRDGRSCCRGCYSKHSDYNANLMEILERERPRDKP